MVIEIRGNMKNRQKHFRELFFLLKPENTFNYNLKTNTRKNNNFKDKTSLNIKFITVILTLLYYHSIYKSSHICNLNMNTSK